MIDPGSEVSLVGEALAQRLRLPRLPASISIFGVGGKRTGTTRGRISFDLHSLTSNFLTRISALVLPQISAYGTRVEASHADWPHIQNLQLADPDFAVGDPIELLLGADVYAALVEDGLRKGGPRAPIAQRTALGWILSGVVCHAEAVKMTSSHHCQADEDITELVRRFWSQEEPPSAPPALTDEEQWCEDLYAFSHRRMPDGRYVVRLPVIPTLPSFEDTRRIASRMLRCMEHRFAANGEMQRLYHDFMVEYEQLGHMSPVPPPHEAERRRVCYLPHHRVIKAAASSKKIRVVFNGSARLASGDSLNAHLAAGPNLLPALTNVLLKWRLKRFVLAADVEKMYRQIMVHPEDRDLQRVLWRVETTGELHDFQLNTVTYGSNVRSISGYTDAPAAGRG
ncbi:PREDICTED: uncharacterized protein LOC105450602 [Wasmannia auropunctata]|uniref:uncharacterized protein LOC105450602 n=1 Tax=Wasmannia auropunctata TaxID=64793 RepID=UPI0005EFA5A4|nr:PREDICTED: uncharacterized protein LOC105450602 [Wasmannia auropunctata]